MESFQDEHAVKGSKDSCLSSPPAVNPMTQAANRRPSLLPAFEPLSSSPLAGPTKRKHSSTDMAAAGTVKYYPTPVPTSSTGILPSSPQHQSLFGQLQQQKSQPSSRPGLQRTVSALSERAPLSAVPSITVPSDGEPLLLGRSSSSSNYQLSANRLISRVHVKATYSPPSNENTSGHVQIECVGWNGAKVHCRGQVSEMSKGQTLTFEDAAAEIMLDVQETRVILAWPSLRGHDRKGSRSLSSAHAWLAEAAASPSRRALAGQHDIFASSPPIFGRPHSPESPTPANRHSNILSSSISPPKADHGSEHALVQIYEDSASDEDQQQANAQAHTQTDQVLSDSRRLNKSTTSDKGVRPLQDTTTSSSPVPAGIGSPDPVSADPGLSDDFSDRDEENDPIVHSFGPFGANILPRFESFSATSPVQLRRQRQHQHQQQHPNRSLKQKSFISSPIPEKRVADCSDPVNNDRTFRCNATSFSSPVKTSSSLGNGNGGVSDSPIRNHVINQLAFSRLHAMPLSTLWGNLPMELKMLPVGEGGVGHVSALPRGLGIIHMKREDEDSDAGGDREMKDSVRNRGDDRDSTTPTPMPASVPAGTTEAHHPIDQPQPQQLSETVLQSILESIACVGSIARQGKDAAGKPLEAQFYYVPEMDENVIRREAVLGGRGGTGLRAVRKSHKQYYWKRPRH